MLANSSDEGVLKGLGWIPGTVRSFDNTPESKTLPLPHMGWNDITSAQGCPLFKGIETDARFYFLHSYFFECQQNQNIAATAGYGLNFSCAVWSGNVYGVQFHPEKSHRFGMRVLEAFGKL